jgi:hypothetical protein
MASAFEHGFIPYRMSNLAMDTMSTSDDSFFDVARQLKQTIDPNGTLSPGRYDPLPPRGRARMHDLR